MDDAQAAQDSLWKESEIGWGTADTLVMGGVMALSRL